jgi:hypothetical protein
MPDKPALDQLDAGTRQLSYSAMPKEIELLDDLIIHLNRGTSILRGSKHDRGLNFLSALLVTRAFNSLWRGREDAVCGYPVQSLFLCRGALEDWGTLVWVESHPDDVDKWLWAILSEVERPTEPPPKFDAIWRWLGDQGKIPGERYGILSKFAHPKSIGLRWLIHFDPESTTFHYGGNFDQRSLRICLFFLVEVAQAFFERVTRLQERWLGQPSGQWVEEASNLSDRALEFVKRVLVEMSAATDWIDSEEDGPKTAADKGRRG